MIPIYVNDEYQSNFYDEKHVKLYTQQFQFFVKKHLNELEHTDLITEWNHNMGTDEYLKYSEKYVVHKPSIKE